MQLEHILTCQFIVPPEDIVRFNLAYAADVAALQNLVCHLKNIALCEEHGPAMLSMLATGNVTGYAEAHTEVVELDDGSVMVSHGVKPVYQMH